MAELIERPPAESTSAGHSFKSYSARSVDFADLHRAFAPSGYRDVAAVWSQFQRLWDDSSSAIHSGKPVPALNFSTSRQIVVRAQLLAPGPLGIQGSSPAVVEWQIQDCALAFLPCDRPASHPGSASFSACILA